MSSARAGEKRLDVVPVDREAAVVAELAAHGLQPPEIAEANTAHPGQGVRPAPRARRREQSLPQPTGDAGTGTQGTASGGPADRHHRAGHGVAAREG